LVQWHEVSLYVAVVALVLWCGLTVASGAWRSRRTAVVVGSTLGAVVLVAVSAVAWNRVRWEQLGLWAVTVDDVRGLWYAAFSDEVRFVFVDGSGGLTPSDLAPSVVLYLVAPFVALAMLAVGWLAARPSRGWRRSIVATDVEPAAGGRVR
jgi:hypothetical protein